jgi:hypothetical protein
MFSSFTQQHDPYPQCHSIAQAVNCWHFTVEDQVKSISLLVFLCQLHWMTNIVFYLSHEQACMDLLHLKMVSKSVHHPQMLNESKMKSD